MPNASLKAPRSMSRKDNADCLGTAGNINADRIALADNRRLLRDEVAEFPIHRHSPSVFGSEGYAPGASNSVAPELAHSRFFEIVQLVEQQRLKIKRSVPGKGKFDGLAPGQKFDGECIPSTAPHFRSVLDEYDPAQVGSLSAPRGCENTKLPKVTQRNQCAYSIYIFISLPPTFKQQRFYIHIVRHFTQFGGIDTKPSGLLQLAFSLCALGAAGHLQNTHKIILSPKTWPFWAVGSCRNTGGTFRERT
jgi:hypothetical protein